MAGSVSVSDLAKWPKVMVEKYHVEIVKQIQISVQMHGPAIIQAIIDGTRPYPPVNTGEYRRNWKVRRISNGALIFNPTKQAGIIGQGRRPGFGVSKEGQEALARWVHLHGMDRFDGTPGMRRRIRSRAARDSRARAIAFLIARKIKARGLPAKNILGRAKPLITAQVMNDVDAVMVRGVA